MVRQITMICQRCAQTIEDTDTAVVLKDEEDKLRFPRQLLDLCPPCGRDLNTWLSEGKPKKEPKAEPKAETKATPHATTTHATGAKAK